MMKLTDKESFEVGLNLWKAMLDAYLNERTKNPLTGKSHYTHKRLRSAYRSLKTNSKWLFTCYDYYEIHIPNTTNAVEAHFSDLKNKLKNHNGLSIQRKMKFIDSFLKV